MVQNPNDFMMAVIVASTALVGLQAVVVGQIASTIMKPKIKGAFIFTLMSSFIVALFAIGSAIFWFIIPSGGAQAAAAGSFGAQLLISGGAIYSFWLSQLQITH